MLRNSSSASAIGANNQLNRQLSNLSNICEATIDDPKSTIADNYESVVTKFNYSPTPSIKRGKAEKLLKEHGSPPGMRVTAGGRVVPTDLAPLGSPRFSGKEIERSTPYAYPSTGSPSKVQFATSKFIPATYVSYHYNNPSSFVNEGQISEFSHNDSFNTNEEPYFSQSEFDHYLPWSIDWQLPEPSIIPTQLNSHPNTFNSQIQNQINLAANMELHGSELLRKQKGLEQQYAKMDFDLREFEKQQVLKQETMTSSERHTTVQRKKEMIVELDKVRKAIKETKQQLEMITYTFNERTPFQSFTSYTQPIYSHAATSTSLRNPISPLVIDDKNVFNESEGDSRFFEGPVTVRKTLQDHSLTSSAQKDPSKQATNNGQRFCTYGRHIEPLLSENDEYRSHLARSNSYSVVKSSHAIPIKDPENSTRVLKSKKTSLDPTSPNYEPKNLAAINKGIEALSPTRPSDITAPNSTEGDYGKHQLRGEGFNDMTSYLHRDRIAGRVSSFSSVATADFFPKDTAEHSSAKYNLSQNTAVTSNGFSRNLTRAWNIETLRREQDSYAQPLLPKSADMFGPIAPPVSPADLCSQRSATGKSDHTSKEMNNAFAEHEMSTRLAEDMLLSALTKYQMDKEHDRAPAQVDIEGRSTSFIEGLYAGLLHDSIPPVIDSDFDKGYCVGLLNSRKNTVISARANSSDESRQSSSLSLKSDIHPIIEPQRPVNIEQSEVSTRALSKPYCLRGEYSFLPKCENKSSSTSALKDMMPVSTASNSNHSSAAPIWTRKSEQPMNKIISNENVSKVPVLPNAWSIIRKEPSSGFQATQATPNYYVSENAVPTKGAGLIGQEVDSFASRIRTYPSYTLYGYNQSSKSGFSVAPSSDQANGLFQQYDGAIGELRDLNSSNSNGSSPSAPVRRLPYNKQDESHSGDTKDLQLDLSPNLIKEVPNSPAISQNSKKTSYSPTKAKIGNLTTMIKNTIKSGEERPDELRELGKHNPKDKSRRKDNWRENWRKRFQEIKTKEKEEIEKYKRENPIE